MKKENQEKTQILIVDDEAGIRNVLKITLESSGYAVCTATDGEAGIKAFVDQKPQIVITDIKMPGIDGIQLLKQIKQMDNQAEVIMITGHGDMDLAVKSLQHEAGDFITKPIDSNELELAIQRAQDRLSITRNIQSYMDGLEMLVKEKDKKINESEKLVTIGQTIAGMSHAIKNIAGGLKGSSFVLEQGIDQENRKYLKQGWEMMKGNIDKITKLSLDLLNYAKTTRLKLSLENPNTPIDDLIPLATFQADEKKIEFKVNSYGGSKQILMDSDAIYDCVMNLVANAFDSFVKEAAERTPKQVTLSIFRQNNRMVYQVEDNGCGINETMKEKIFKDFITDKGSKGTGFGLMTTKKIVEEHNGCVGFKSVSGQGAIFYIQIPTCEQA